MTAPLRLMQHLDAHDRRLLGLWALGEDAATMHRRGWIVVTHAGGAVVTIASVLIPLLLRPILPPQRLLRRQAFALFAARFRGDLFQLHRLQRRERIVLAPFAEIVERAAVLLQPFVDLGEKLVLPRRIIDRAFARFDFACFRINRLWRAAFGGELADDPQRLARLFAIDLAGHSRD